MVMFGIILWLFITLIAGLGFLMAVSGRKRILLRGESIALSYGIGMALITIGMALLSFFGIAFSVFSISILSMPFILAAFISYRYKAAPAECDEAGRPAPFSFLEIFLVSAILFEILYAFFKALVRSMEAYDAVAIYAFQSKIFYLAGGIPADYYTAFKGIVPHIEYPLLVPLAEAFFYNFIGSWNDQLVKLIFPLYYVSMLAILYSVIRRILGRRESLLFTFLLASIPQFQEYGTNGYADLVLAFYCSISAFYLYLWIREGISGYLILSFVLAALSAWAKTEGLMLILVNMAVTAVYIAKEGRRYFFKGAIYMVLLISVISLCVILKKEIGIDMHENFTQKGMFEPLRLMANLGRIPLILYQFQIQFFGPKKWNIIWILVIAGFFLNLKAVFRGPIRYLTLWLLFVMCGYAAVYIVIPGNIGWIISSNLSRFFIHFTPAAVLWLAVLFKELELKI